jgi:hypothetical protein
MAHTASRTAKKVAQGVLVGTVVTVGIVVTAAAYKEHSRKKKRERMLSGQRSPNTHHKDNISISNWDRYVPKSHEGYL